MVVVQLFLGFLEHVNNFAGSLFSVFIYVHTKEYPIDVRLHSCVTVSLPVWSEALMPLLTWMQWVFTGHFYRLPPTFPLPELSFRLRKKDKRIYVCPKKKNKNQNKPWSEDHVTTGTIKQFSHNHQTSTRKQGGWGEGGWETNKHTEW